MEPEGQYHDCHIGQNACQLRASQDRRNEPGGRLLPIFAAGWSLFGLSSLWYGVLLTQDSFDLLAGDKTHCQDLLDSQDGQRVNVSSFMPMLAHIPLELERGRSQQRGWTLCTCKHRGLELCSSSPPQQKERMISHPKRCT
eukprot:3757635-Amphidinium_carterae.1